MSSCKEEFSVFVKQNKDNPKYFSKWNFYCYDCIQKLNPPEMLFKTENLEREENREDKEEGKEENREEDDTDC